VGANRISMPCMPFIPRKLDQISVGQVDYAVGCLRGMLGIDLDLSESYRANLEQAIEHVRAAARYVERQQRSSVLQRRGTRRRKS
jgi:hypothetical protein